MHKGYCRKGRTVTALTLSTGDGWQPVTDRTFALVDDGLICATVEPIDAGVWRGLWRASNLGGAPFPSAFAAMSAVAAARPPT